MRFLAVVDGPALVAPAIHRVVVLADRHVPARLVAPGEPPEDPVDDQALDVRIGEAGLGAALLELIVVHEAAPLAVHQAEVLGMILAVLRHCHVLLTLCEISDQLDRPPSSGRSGTALFRSRAASSGCARFAP